MGHRWKGGGDRVELPYTANTNNNNNNNNSNNEETRQDSDWLPVPAKIHVKKFITPILLFPPTQHSYRMEQRGRVGYR